MKTVYLHIGLPKTGSSQLQKNFLEAPGVLARMGVHYLHSGVELFDDGGHHALVMGILGAAGMRIDPSKTPEAIQRAWALAMREIDICEEPNVLISSELFSMEVYEHTTLARLQQALAANGRRVKVIIVLRDVVDFVNSLYAQRIKDGAAETFGAYLALIWPLLDWRALVQRWADIFGPDNIRCLRYESFDRARLSDDFLSQGMGLAHEGQLFSASQTNISWSHLAVQFLAELGRAVPEPETRALRAEIRHVFDTLAPRLPRPDFVGPDLREVLRRHCVWPPACGPVADKP